MRGPAFLIGAAIVTLPVTAAADDASVEGLIAEVLARNPSVQARVLRRAALGEDARAAGIYPDPQVAVMVDRVPQAHEFEMPMLRYQATQMFPWPGKLGLMRSVVEQQGEAAGAEVDVRRLDLRLETKRAYYMLSYVARRREIVGSSQSLARTIAQASLGRYASGVASHHEVVRAQVEVNALDVELTNLAGERASMLAMINALRDRPFDAPLPEPVLVPSPTRDLDPGALAARAYAKRPELRGMRAMEGEALAMASVARRERYPDIMGSVWMNQTLMGGVPPSAGAMVGVTVPVFGLARQAHRAGAEERRAEGASKDAGAMRAMIRFQVADAVVRVQAASRRVELLGTVVLPKARESFETSLAGYGSGSVDIVGLLDARRSLQTASLAVAEATVDREIALAELERAVGGAP